MCRTPSCCRFHRGRHAKPARQTLGSWNAKLRHAAANDSESHPLHRADAEAAARANSPVSSPKTTEPILNKLEENGGHAKLVAGVQNALRLRRKREQQQERKHGSHQLHGQFELPGTA